MENDKYRSFELKLSILFLLITAIIMIVYFLIRQKIPFTLVEGFIWLFLVGIYILCFSIIRYKLRKKISSD